MWRENSQLSLVATNVSCPGSGGSAEQLACLRQRSGSELRAALIASGAQFQPVTDNVTVFMECVWLIFSWECFCTKQPIAMSLKLGEERPRESLCSLARTEYVPMHQGSLQIFPKPNLNNRQDEGTLIVEGEPTAYLDTIDAYRCASFVKIIELILMVH